MRIVEQEFAIVHLVPAVLIWFGALQFVPYVREDSLHNRGPRGPLNDRIGAVVDQRFNEERGNLSMHALVDHSVFDSLENAGGLLESRLREVVFLSALRKMLSWIVVRARSSLAEDLDAFSIAAGGEVVAVVETRNDIGVYT